MVSCGCSINFSQKLVRNIILSNRDVKFVDGIKKYRTQNLLWSLVLFIAFSAEYFHLMGKVICSLVVWMSCIMAKQMSLVHMQYKTARVLVTPRLRYLTVDIFWDKLLSMWEHAAGFELRQRLWQFRRKIEKSGC